MAAVPTGSSFPVPTVASHPGGEAYHIFQSVGTLSGAVFNQANGGLSYILAQALKPFVLNHLDVSHDGISGGYGNSVEMTLYRVPEGVSISTAVYAGSTYRVASQVSEAYDSSSFGPGKINIPLQGEDRTGRTFNRGDRLVITFRSTADSPTTAYYSTQIANVSVAGLGLTVQGAFGNN